MAKKVLALIPNWTQVSVVHWYVPSSYTFIECRNLKVNKGENVFEFEQKGVHPNEAKKVFMSFLTSNFGVSRVSKITRKIGRYKVKIFVKGTGQTHETSFMNVPDTLSNWWKKWATGQSCNGKEVIYYKIHILAFPVNIFRPIHNFSVIT